MKDMINDLKLAKNGSQISYEELEEMAGVGIHPGRCDKSSGEWMKYLEARRDLKNAINKEANSAGLKKREYFQLVPCTLEVLDEDGEIIGREYCLQILKGEQLSAWHIKNGMKRLEGASKNAKRRLIRTKSKAYLPPQEKNRLNAVLAVVDIHEKLCVKTIEKYDGNAYGKHKALPESSLRLLVDNTVDESFEEAV